MAQLSTTKAVELVGPVLLSLCLASTQLGSVANPLATMVAVLFLFPFSLTGMARLMSQPSSLPLALPFPLRVPLPAPFL